MMSLLSLMLRGGGLFASFLGALSVHLFSEASVWVMLPLCGALLGAGIIAFFRPAE